MTTQKLMMLVASATLVFSSASFAAVASGGQNIATPLLTYKHQGGNIAPKFGNLNCAIYMNGTTITYGDGSMESREGIKFTNAIPDLAGLDKARSLAVNGKLVSTKGSNPDMGVSTYVANFVKPGNKPFEVVLKKSAFLGSQVNKSSATQALVELL